MGVSQEASRVQTCMHLCNQAAMTISMQLMINMVVTAAVDRILFLRIASHACLALTLPLHATSPWIAAIYKMHQCAVQLATVCV